MITHQYRNNVPKKGMNVCQNINEKARVLVSGLVQYFPEVNPFSIIFGHNYQVLPAKY
jgi:hypothetical protein